MKISRSIRERWCSKAILIAFAATLAVCILPALASALTCDCDICVDTDGWWRNGGVFNGSGTPIQAAVDNAGSGETIYVWNGSYSENVNVDKRVTLRGEGADVVTVTNSTANHHVFTVTEDKTVRKNTSTTINAHDTVKCDLIVNMTEPASINITETGINPEGEGTDDISGLVQVENFLCIQHNASSGIGNFTIRRYYDPSLNYIEVYLYYYNTTPDPNLWERLQTTASGTKDGLNWTETMVNHLSTYVLLGRLADDGVSTDNRRGGSGGPYITSTPTVLATEVQTDTPVTEDMAAPAGIGMDTGMDESTPIQTEKKGLLVFAIVFAVAGVLAAVYVVIRRRNDQD